MGFKAIIREDSYLCTCGGACYMHLAYGSGELEVGMDQGVLKDPGSNPCSATKLPECPWASHSQPYQPHMVVVITKGGKGLCTPPELHHLCISAQYLLCFKLFTLLVFRKPSPHSYFAVWIHTFFSQFVGHFRPASARHMG